MREPKTFNGHAPLLRRGICLSKHRCCTPSHPLATVSRVRTVAIEIPNYTLLSKLGVTDRLNRAIS